VVPHRRHAARRLGDQINQWVGLWLGLFDIAAKALLVLVIPSSYGEVLGKRAAAILEQVEQQPFDPVLHDATVKRVANQLQHRHAHWLAEMHAADRRLRASTQQPLRPLVLKSDTAGTAAMRSRFQQAADGLWTVSYADNERVGLTNLAGMALIRLLLAAPGRGFSAAYLLERSQLDGAADTNALDEAQFSRQRGRGRRTSAGQLRSTGVPTLDAKAIRDVKAKLEELAESSEAANDRGDHRAAQQMENESDLIKTQLTKDLGPAGRPRHIGSHAERDRHTASHRYRTALSSIEESLPELADYIRRCVRPGRTFVYQPDDHQITWLT
jgi:hypothetical protein